MATLDTSKLVTYTVLSSPTNLFAASKVVTYVVLQPVTYDATKFFFGGN